MSFYSLDIDSNSRDKFEPIFLSYNCGKPYHWINNTIKRDLLQCLKKSNKEGLEPSRLMYSWIVSLSVVVIIHFYTSFKLVLFWIVLWHF